MDKENRRLLLSQMLAERNLELRADSKLCEGYIEHGDDCEFDLQTIVDIMEEMDFYYKKTPYITILRNDIYKMKMNTSNILTDDDHEEIRKIAKIKALKIYKFKNKENEVELASLPPRIQELVNNA